MELPLTPMEFARRARRLYASREAVVDGDLRLTYGQFFDRCDRWSHVLQQQLGVGHGDRVAYIAPNTHAQLESFYAVPQLGAVLVPINYRLTADDFAYIIGHSGAKVVCAHADHLDAVDSIRDQLSGVEHFVALEGGPRDGWLDYESLVTGARPEFLKPTIDEGDLLSINYTSGTTSRPKGVMITHRNAYMNIVGTLCHISISSADTYLWTLPMFHANGWTFVWIITAMGARHVCLRRVEPARIFELINAEHVTMLCAAPTVLIGVANAPTEQRQDIGRTKRCHRAHFTQVGPIRRQRRGRAQHVDLVVLAVDQPTGEPAREPLATREGQRVEVDRQAKLFLDLARRLRRRLAEPPVAGRCRVPVPAEGVLVDRPPLQHDFGPRPHDPAVKRLVPIAIEVNGRAWFGPSGWRTRRVKNFQKLVWIVLLRDALVPGHGYRL